MVSESFAIGDHTGGLKLSKGREASPRSASEAVAVSSAQDLSYS